jgi:tetratricopeptide (TPR) repeat protein
VTRPMGPALPYYRPAVAHRLLVTVVLGAMLAGSSPRAVGQAASAVSVEPGELTRRPELVGKVVSVEDRVRLFQFHQEIGWDEIVLKRSPDVTFALPPQLRPKQNPQAPVVRLQGVLRRDGGRFTVDVEVLELLPSDLDRLNGAVSRLARSDVETRTGWARWAEGRAKAFQDEPLLRRAREVEADAIRAEAEKPPSGSDPATFALGLAEQARQRQLAEPEPSALAHRGFRAALAGARSAADLTALAGRIEMFLPQARKAAGPDAETELERWKRPYAADPAAAYRSASPTARAALDHRLWADVTRQRIDRLAAADSQAAVTLAEEAATLLPDEPELATALLEKGLGAQSRNIAALRQEEVETLARLYRDRLKQPDKARELYRAWLNDQRVHRLSARDAEGRLNLADKYRALLDDSATAVALLREAWAIDPRSREVADAFRRLGYRKVGDEWVEPAQADAGADRRKASPTARTDPPKAERRPDPAPAGPDRGGGDGGASLVGATPAQVRTHFGGKPNHHAWCVTQGQVTEQWTYVEPRHSHYVTFVRKAGENHPRVTSFYSLPRQGLQTPSAP